jgi:hypothetical protein
MARLRGRTGWQAALLVGTLLVLDARLPRAA